jgi:diguanylate cyclase (GGDEF)-like protein
VAPADPSRRISSASSRRSSAVVTDGARIAALRDLGILDTEPEDDFDRFTRLASELLEAPVSLVSLVDRDRQFFKSQHGLPEPWASARQTPLSHSFCQHAVGLGLPLVIEDARHDPLVADNLAVRDLSAMAYAGVPLVLEDGHAVGTLCVVDTVPRHWAERDLRILADLAAAVQALIDLRYAAARHTLHDHLTGLPSRVLTVAYAEQLAARQTTGDLLAVTIGVNDLGAINEVYGTIQGDRVLKLVGRRIAHELGPDDVLGRLDGDVFAVIRTGVSDQLQALALAQRIREGVAAQAVRIRSDQLPVSVTVGIAFGAAGGEDGDADQLIRRAAEVMRMAKGQRDRVMVADADRTLSSAARLRTRGALRGAVAREEITVAFQPIVELATGVTQGFEALARWEHPELGSVAPSEFIPVAEATGEIVLIGEHVLRTACRQLAEWRAESGQDLHITVNLSPVQLAVPNFADVLREILLANRLPGPAVVLEITEGVFMAPELVARRNLAQIRELGVRIALDDFGTGYSALSYLKRFPVDVIKADRSFLDGLGADRRDLAVLRAILAIGDGMDIQVVAEGIETQRQRELLRLSGCPFGQGFLFARPLPAEEIVIGRRPRHPSALRGMPGHEARLAASPTD